MTGENGGGGDPGVPEAVEPAQAARPDHALDGGEPSPPRKAPLPALDELHQRHHGLTEPVCLSFAEAAAVALDRHHAPPADFNVTAEDGPGLRALAWTVSSARARAAWNNTDDATRDGAYAIAAAAVEAEMGLFAIGRADTRTGADYYFAPAQAADLETAVRVEVSGVDRGGEGEVKARLKRKLKQAQAGKSDLPAAACIVAFKARRVAIARLAAGG